MRRLPAELLEQAAEYASGERTPAEPRNAATVILLGQRSSGPDEQGPLVYLLRRQTSMRFAGGMCVFPGGRVDDRDFTEEVGWAGPTPAEWAERLDVDEATARALVCAAVRETFEESGVLLAGPSDDEVVGDTTGDDWEADRAALEGHSLSMTEFLQRRGLVLRTDLLGAFSAWLTPVFEPRRYRTWFFVAALPPEQRTRDVSTESDRVAWLPVKDALARVDAGEIMMMPPTYLTCLELAEFADPESVVAACPDRTIEMFTPQVVASGDEATMTHPERFDALLARHRPGDAR